MEEIRLQAIETHVRIVTEYAAHRTQREPREDRAAFCRKALQSGLLCCDLMNAVDAAVCALGLGRLEREYWDAIERESRERWTKLRQAGMV